MNYTYNIKWKGPVTNVAIPTNSRPFNNLDGELRTLGRTPFKANPIKGWRKSLNPYYKTRSSKQVSISQIEAPTSANTITSETQLDNLHLLKENVIILSRCNGIKLESADGSRCIGGTNNVRRSASTNIKSNYYTSNSSYLKAKCKTHASRSMLGDKNDDGSYTSVKCSNNTDACTKVGPIIYKPSNLKYSQQGAVSSSTNILNKKNNTINRNNASLKATYGQGSINTKTHHDTAAGTGYVINYLKGSGTTKNRCGKGKHKCGL